MKNILVVDEDNYLRKQLSEIIKEHGFLRNILEVNDAQEAMKLLKDNEGDIGLVMCNWQMTQISGLDFATWIGEHPNLRNIPIVFLTGHDLTEHIDQIMTSNANVEGFLFKPFKIDQFGLVVGSLLKNS